MKLKLTPKSLIISLAILIAIIGIWFWVVLFTSTVSQPTGITYNLRQGLGKKTFITEVASQNIIKHPWIFATYMSFHPTAQLKAGEYLFPAGSSPASIWRQVTTGQGMVPHRFTIIPGWTFVQLKEALAQKDDVKHDIMQMTDQQIMQQLGNPNVSPEGEFFPDTYSYLRDASDLTILKRAYKRMQKKLTAAWLARDNQSTFKTPYEALTAASIIEKEAYLASERPIIAGVLINRLKQDMLLQFDPTVIYGMGNRYQGKIYKTDLTEDTPYNTYIHKGLPPTPIAIPSLSSINAVLHPQQNNFLYFVARGDGSHQFSETLTEHNTAVATAIQKAKETEKSKATNYVSPNAGQRYLQSLMISSMVQAI